MPLADMGTANTIPQSASLEVPLKVSTSASPTCFPDPFGDMDLGVTVLSRSSSVVEIPSLPPVLTYGYNARPSSVGTLRPANAGNSNVMINDASVNDIDIKIGKIDT